MGTDSCCRQSSALSEKYFGVAKLAKSFGHSELPKVLATFATERIPKSFFDDALVNLVTAFGLPFDGRNTDRSRC